MHNTRIRTIVNSCSSIEALPKTLTWSLLIALAIQCSNLAEAEQFDWNSARPEDKGFSNEELNKLRDSLIRRGTHALLVIRDDAVVYEWYEPGRSRTDKHYTASMAKALIGGVSLAIALNNGYLHLDDKVARYVPQWSNDEIKSQITVRQLGSHTSGIEDAEEGNLPHEVLTGWKGIFGNVRSPLKIPLPSHVI